MTLSNEAVQYAKQHPQEVALSWVDGSLRTYDALKAVKLCGVPGIAACIMGTRAKDTALQALLDRLIDSE